MERTNMEIRRLARLVLVGLVLAAPAAGCGAGGNGNKEGAAGAGVSSTDGAYVSGLCRSFGAFSNSIQESLTGPTPADVGAALGQLLKALIEPTRQFSDAFGKLQPPPDLAEWHRTTAAQLAAAAAALKDGKFDAPALQGLSGSPIPGMPDAARARLNALASRTDECKKVNPFDSSRAGSSPGSNAATPALKDAAVGNWSGRFGTLEFSEDGTAKFDLKNVLVPCRTDTSSQPSDGYPR